MQVLVDTSVWSLALRRPATPADAAQQHAVTTLRDLIGDGRAMMIGPVRQELLCGIKEASQFERLRTALVAFPDTPILQTDHERAAAYFNTCRSRGIQGSNTDFLICAVAVGRKLPIFSLDGDFSLFQRYLPIALL